MLGKRRKAKRENSQRKRENPEGHSPEGKWLRHNIGASLFRYPECSKMLGNCSKCLFSGIRNPGKSQPPVQGKWFGSKQGFPGVNKKCRETLFFALFTCSKLLGIDCWERTSEKTLRKAEKQENALFPTLLSVFSLSTVPLHHFSGCFLFSKVSKSLAKYPEKGPSQNIKKEKSKKTLFFPENLRF